jgi:hypothetical protein
VEVFLSGDQTFPVTLPHVEDRIRGKAGLVGRPRTGPAVLSHAGESEKDENLNLHFVGGTTILVLIVIQHFSFSN